MERSLNDTRPLIYSHHVYSFITLTRSRKIFAFLDVSGRPEKHEKALKGAKKEVTTTVKLSKFSYRELASHHTNFDAIPVYQCTIPIINVNNVNLNFHRFGDTEDT